MASRDKFTTGDDASLLLPAGIISRRAQTFIAQYSYTCTGIKLKLYRIGSPGTLTVKIYESVGAPGEPPEGTATTEGDGITTNTSGEWVQFEFSSSFTITLGTEYWIVLETPSNGDVSNQVGWRLDSNNGYAFGSLLYWYPNTWGQQATKDHLFDALTGLSKPTNPTPSDADTRADFSNLTLSWDAVDGADTYDIYFGPVGDLSLLSEAQAGVSLVVNTADVPWGETVSWRVDASDAEETVTGDTWSFAVVDIQQVRMGSAGDFLLVTATDGVYLSTDLGANWTRKTPDSVEDTVWEQGICSSDGTYIIVVSDANAIYRSANSGTAWGAITPAGGDTFTVNDLAISDDGQFAIIVGQNTTDPTESCYISTDYGATWTAYKPVASSIEWTECSISNDGTIIAVSATGYFYISLDSGSTWLAQGLAASAETWECLGISGDGTAGIVANTNDNNDVFLGVKTTLYSRATWAESALTAAGRALLDDATAAAQATTLGLGVGDAVTHDTLTLSSIAAEATDVDKFLVDSTGLIKYRTGTQVLSDIGAAASGHLHDTATLQHDGVNSDGGAFSFTTTGTVTFNQSVDILHTSTEADDHAFEIDVDAGGYGDVKAIDIAYITGAIATGEDEGIILINIDEIAAAGGDVFGLEVLATEGAAGSTTTVYGLKAGVLIGPIHQDSGTFVNPAIGTNDTPQTPVANMIDGDSGPTKRTTIFVAVDDYIIIGATVAFQEIEFILTTPTSNPGIKPTFWYSTGGSGFTEFTPVDGTNGFRNTGVVAWDADDLTGHVVNADTGAANTFDIKIIRTKAGSLSPSPILGYAKVAATTEYIWDKDGDVNIRSLTIDGTVATGLDMSGGTFSGAVMNWPAAPVIQVNGTQIIKTDSTNFNVFFGDDSFQNDNGQRNTSFGYQAGYYNDTTGSNGTQYGDRNLYIGYCSGYGDAGGNTGYKNVAIGAESLYSNSSGYSNVAFGNWALYNNTTGYTNVALGTAALYDNIGGYSNVAIGGSSLYKNTYGYHNTGIGFRTGYWNVTGDYNVYIGSQAGGSNAGSNNSNGGNTAIGTFSAFNLTTGYGNTFNGYYSGGAITNGDYNVFLGFRAGFRQTTADNLLIIDNQDRGNAALEITDCLIYGIFNAAPASQSLRFNVGNLYLGNPTHSDADGGGAVIQSFIREDGAGTASTAATITGSHDGVVANDQLAKMTLGVNTGAGVVDALVIDSSLDATFEGNLFLSSGGTLGVGTGAPVTEFDCRGDMIMYDNGQAFGEGMNIFLTNAAAVCGLNLHIGAAGTVPATDTLKGMIRIWKAAPNNMTASIRSAGGGEKAVWTAISPTGSLNLVPTPTLGNVSIFCTEWGANAVATLAIGSWSAPTTSPADCFQLYSADWNGAGTACAHFRTEEGIIVRLNQDVATTAAVVFDDVTVSNPVNIYNLSHDSFADGGAHDYAYITGNDGGTGITAAELEELSDGSETALHSHAGGIDNISSQSVLAADFTITAAINTYEDTGLSVDLPSAGTYLVFADIRSYVEDRCWIGCKFYNSTDAADVANSETMSIFGWPAGATIAQSTTPLNMAITVAAAKTIKLYAKRSVVKVAKIKSDTAGRTRMGYIKLES